MGLEEINLRDVANPAALEDVIALAERYEYEEEHSWQDARLALRIFDLTRDLHQLSDDHRDLLLYAAILHDIGYWYDYDKHHKHAYKMIRDADIPSLSPREKLIVANIARYHRSARPEMKHKGFAKLNEEDREAVRMLGAVLRFADGLDRTHTNAVRALDCEMLSDSLIFTVYPSYGNDTERWAGQKKGRFFEEVFDVAVRLR